MTEMNPQPSIYSSIVSALASGLAFMGLDLIWLGFVAKPIYDENLASLRAEEVNWTAAILFYVMYITVIQLYAIRPSSSVSQAAGKGAGMGFFAYATYELTNWAVIANWPSGIVLIDILWGIVLTSSCAAAGAVVNLYLLKKR